MNSSLRFLAACRREPVDVTPVWIMRQAGRYLPQYRVIRSRVSFMELCKTPELAAEVTCQPLDALGVDAAILFSDILIALEAMGAPVEFTGEGPRLGAPLRTRADAERLRAPDPWETMPFTLETVRILRRELKGKAPLIGFAGAPFTLASYLVEGGSSRDFRAIKDMMYLDPALLHALMTKIAKTAAALLNAEIEAGAQAVQLFDTWAGTLSPRDYREFALEHTREVVSELNRAGVPVILYVNGCAGILELMAESGADVIGLDWRVEIDAASARLGGRFAVQGNLDPAALFLPPEKIRERVDDVLARAAGAPGHVFNLGHGIHPDTPVEHAVAMVDAVHTRPRDGKV
ncbi:MAG: uroporphyrinogen decarboxylase [bacterium]